MALRLRGVAGKLNNIDIGVVFTNPAIVHNDTFPVYGKLYDIFFDAFGSENLDIVLLERATLELKFDVITHGKVLFEISSDLRDAFERRISMLYADFRPILENFNATVLARIP